MVDIFFSYSSSDRERVRPIRNALAAQGFEVFWDQQVPPGTDWDTWIRQHLTKSKCVLAFWSATSVLSDNVRHEATIAKQQRKLISILLETLTADQFPMGLYHQQAVNLSDWNGDHDAGAWRTLQHELKVRLTPSWVRKQIDDLEAELIGERARREGAERRDRILQGQIAKEVMAQQDLKQERDNALDEVAALKAAVEKSTRAEARAAAENAGKEAPPSAERLINGSIYLAKVTRVEPSLSGAFLNYADKSFGFLPFDNIHPDYYQIPFRDREHLIDEMNRGRVWREGASNREGAMEAAGNEARVPSRRSHSYKIEQVIKHRQLMLVQAEREPLVDSALLTTHLSLLGHYAVLTPNNAGHSISREIADPKERKRLAEIMQGLDVPTGMGVILRMQSASTSEADIARDFKRLSQLWDGIRELTMRSTAPAHIYDPKTW
jgi:hypothetical protein